MDGNNYSVFLGSCVPKQNTLPLIAGVLQDKKTHVVSRSLTRQDSRS